MLHSNISHTWAATVWHGPSLPSNMNIWRVWLISSHSCFLAPESPACSSCFHSDYLGYFCCIVIGLENERLESWILIPWWECLFLTWDVRLAWSFLIFHGSLQFASGSVHGISHKRDGFLVEEGNIPGKFCPTAIKKKKAQQSEQWRPAWDDLRSFRSSGVWANLLFKKDLGRLKGFNKYLLDVCIVLGWWMMWSLFLPSWSFCL